MELKSLREQTKKPAILAGNNKHKKAPRISRGLFLLYNSTLKVAFLVVVPFIKGGFAVNNV